MIPPSIKASDLFEVFLELFSVDRKDITYRRFTLAIQTGIKVGFLKLRTKKKLTFYLGVSREILDSALDALEVAEDLADAA